MYYVYVLCSSKDNGLYIGLTKDIEERLRMHNSGYEQATKSRRPFKLVVKFSVDSIKGAREYEKRLKTGFGREKIRLYILGQETYGGLLKWLKRRVC